MNILSRDQHEDFVWIDHHEDIQMDGCENFVWRDRDEDFASIDHHEDFAQRDHH